MIHHRPGSRVDDASQEAQLRVVVSAYLISHFSIQPHNPTHRNNPLRAPHMLQTRPSNLPLPPPLSASHLSETTSHISPHMPVPPRPGTPLRDDNDPARRPAGDVCASMMGWGGRSCDATLCLGAGWGRTGDRAGGGGGRSCDGCGGDLGLRGGRG